MLRYFIYSVLSLTLACQVTCLSQDIPEDDTTAGQYYIIKFNLITDTDTDSWAGPLPGDSYVVSYDKETLTTVSDTKSVVEGLNTVEMLKDVFNVSITIDLALFSLTFTSSDRGCMLNATNLNASRMGDTILFSQIEANPVKVFYDRVQFCENDPLPATPMLSDSLADILYSSPDGLNIDSSTGVFSIADQPAGSYTVRYASKYCLEGTENTITINPEPTFTIEKNRRVCENHSIELAPVTFSDATFSWSDGTSGKSIMASQPGEYILTAESEFGCLHTDTVKVELKNIVVEEFDYEVTHADCYDAGRINIKQLDILNGELPYMYQFENRINGQLVQETNNLREGDYILTIEDAEGCRTTVERIISIRKDCLNDYPVFSPNTDGRDDDYFIPYEGKAIVYDRNGIERARFIAPAYWDGTDENGNPLPMGTYIIVVDKQEVINITIVK